MSYENRWETVDVKVEDGIAWVTLNRPEKKNAMSPTLSQRFSKSVFVVTHVAGSGNFFVCIQNLPLLWSTAGVSEAVSHL